MDRQKSIRNPMCRRRIAPAACLNVRRTLLQNAASPPVSLFSLFGLRHKAVPFQPEREAVFRNLQLSNQGTNHVAPACMEARTREAV